MIWLDASVDHTAVAPWASPRQGEHDVSGERSDGMSGWPDEARPGVPLNPERDGWHWLLFPHPANQPKCRRWTRLANGQFDWVNLHDANLYDYLGPCLTPAEVAAQLTAAQAERDLTRPDEEITRLRAALRQIAEYDHLGDPAAIAREALGLPPTED